MLSVLALAAATLAPVADQVHQTSITHEGRSLDIAYRADTKLSTRQIGMSAGPRAGTERCLWTAHVTVMREAGRSSDAAISHRLNADKLMSGSQTGSCIQNRALIEKEVARRDDDVRAHLAAVATHDAPQLAADLAALRTLAVN